MKPAVLVCVLALLVAVGCERGIAVGLVTVVQVMVLTCDALTLVRAAAGCVPGLAIMAVFSIMLADLRRQ